jgi:signal transduction histidine kinase
MSLRSYVRALAVFVPCYLLLDWVSYIDPLGPFNITPWNPQPALAIVWMVLGGLGYAPAVFATIALADALIRDVPAGYGLLLSTALVLTAGYAALAHLIRRFLGAAPALRSLRELTTFTVLVVPGTALIAGAFIASLWLGGQIHPDAVLSGWLRFWVGDAVGVLVTAPLLLVASDGERRARLRALAKRPETYVQIGLVGLALWLIFAGLGGDPSHHVYLLFLPLIWIAVRAGMAGAVVALAIIQIGVVFGIHARSGPTFPTLELQALVAGLTLTGLYLGVMFEERSRAEEGLRQSLRLAAAGEMAGAIAHEVNQPLTALINYGHSAQMLLDAGRSAELAGILQRILGEGQRAAEIVRRLRDFFREGATRLERVPVEDLLEAVRRIGAGLDRKPSAALDIRSEAGLPPVLVDRLQIELVLRNLLTNAFEAADGHASPARVRVDATRQDAAHLRITVCDSGPGVPEAQADRIFEAFVSGKPTGMGLGLAVSRAIAEAHGGTLSAAPGASGEFRLVLPFEAHGA